MMKNLKMYCLCLHDKNLPMMQKLGYTPVGLGKDNFSSEWLRDNTGENISSKNRYYGEYTFHYWLWKNYIDLDNVEDGWFGFCQYRKFWSINDDNLIPKTINELKPLALKNIPETYENFDAVLGNPYFINQFKIFCISQF